MSKIFTQINVVLDPSLLEEIDRAVANAHISRNKWVIQALQEKLEKELK